MPRLAKVEQADAKLSKVKLAEIVNAIAAPGAGILAADESPARFTARFAKFGMENTPDNRCAYRDMLLSNSKIFNKPISAVILHEETTHQRSAASGQCFVDVVAQGGAQCGVKVDRGAKPLAGCPGETVTEGLDGLRERLGRFHEAGLSFAKWRAPFVIGAATPSRGAIAANALSLAQYAAICQDTQMVPIIEPELCMDGASGDHTIDACYAATCAVLHEVFAALALFDVACEGIVLKVNMVLAGKNAAQQAAAEKIAELTLRCFRNCVPAAVPAIVFLSGGQTDVEATRNLNALSALSQGPWRLTFSYGRALQQSALAAWRGGEKPEDVANAQRIFMHRARMNALATRGQWAPELEEAISTG